jgi:F420-non-reducing hydrogenase iron-sulfur subunit
MTLSNKKLVSQAYEPKIIGFLCDACAYVGADKAGVHRTQYPANIRIIRLMCSGRLDPTFVLEAFRKGIDGVFVAGCHLGDCHYEKGNFKAMKRYELLKHMLSQFGIDPRRLKLEWVSAAEGDKFARKATEFVVDVARLGPIGKPWEVE